MPRRGPDVLKVPEVAADLRVDRKTVYSLIREGELRALRMGADAPDHAPGPRGVQGGRPCAVRLTTAAAGACTPATGLL
jgi:excisionase family DNA binding protein